MSKKEIAPELESASQAIEAIKQDLEAALVIIEEAKQDYLRMLTHLNTFRLMAFGMKYDQSVDRADKHLVSLEREVIDCETWLAHSFNRLFAPQAQTPPQTTH